MKKWNDISNLGLLDDGGGTPTQGLPERAWEDLTRKAAKTEATPKIVAPTRPSPRTEAIVARRKRIFSSSPTLRQMMSEYNRPAGRMAPIKSQSIPANENDFNFQAVDLIEIPVIPGKILRPARGTSDADT